MRVSGTLKKIKRLNEKGVVKIKKNLIFDYLVMSFKVSKEQSSCFLRWLMQSIHFPLEDAESIKSYYGLGRCFFYRGVKIHLSNELVILDCSGKGCRTIEALNNDFDWYQFLHTFDYFVRNRVKDGTQHAVNFARIDLACDLLEDTKITVPFIQRFVRQEKFLCKSNYHSVIEGNYEMAVYFGSPRSDRRLRIYDKALEQGIDGYNWVRFEFQLRNDNATSFYLNLSDTCHGDFVRCYYGMLHDYLRFITQPNDHMNSDRKKVCPWWKSFLEGVGKIAQLYLPADDYDLPALFRFLNHQCGSSMRTYLEAHGGDVTGLVAMASGAKLNKKQLELLDNLRKDESDENCKLIDASAAPALQRTESLALYKASEESRKYEERYKHWVPLGCSLDAVKVYEESKGKLMSDIAAEDLPFD